MKKCKPSFRDQLNLKGGEIVKVADAITYCIQYHKINSRPNTLANYRFLLGKFGNIYNDRAIDSISTEEIIAFWADITEGENKTPNEADTRVCQLFFI